MPLTDHNSHCILITLYVFGSLTQHTKPYITKKGCCLQMPSLLEDPRLIYSSPASEEVSPFDFSKGAKSM